MKNGVGWGRGLSRATKEQLTNWDAAGRGVVAKPRGRQPAAPIPVPVVSPGAPRCSVPVGKGWHLPLMLVQAEADPPLQREANPAIWAHGKNQLSAYFAKTFAQSTDALE